MPLVGNPSFDFSLEDGLSLVRIQVKLQRSEKGVPLKTRESSKRFAPGMFVVETHRTRGGRDRKTGEETRPYKFGEFDILCVAMQPSTQRWDQFLYTVANWLIPGGEDPSLLSTFQPVPPLPNDDWTDDFATCVNWLRSGEKKTIRGLR